VTIVDIQGVTLRRDGTTILSGVDWTIERGQHWALLGANGSGKTTLLKVLTGYEWASQGTVTVLGRRFGACDLRELRKTIGWVSAALQGRIPPFANVIDVVLSGFEASLGVYREFTSGERAAAQECLTHLNVAHLSQRTFATLSQGEQQRVLIARALVIRPALLILDEPCAGLDPAARERFLADLATFANADNAPTTVLVTHHVEEVGPWISHGIVLKDGAVLAAGTLDEILLDEIMSSMLNAGCRVIAAHGRYRLEIV
jgi:iron complex transport system ATP-binding protein